jgi:hypothetical protein
MAKALEKCPHYRIECDDSASKQCQYVQRHTATSVAVLASLEAVRDLGLGGDIREYRDRIYASLRKMGITYG